MGIENATRLSDLVEDGKTLEDLRLFVKADHENKDSVDLCIQCGKRKVTFAEIKVFARGNPNDFFRDFEAAKVIAEDLVIAFNNRGNEAEGKTCQDDFDEWNERKRSRKINNNS